MQLILFFDVFLLVMRDADLWDDFAVWVRKTFGRVGSMVILAAQLVEGDSGDEIGDCIFKNTKAPNLAKFQPPSKLEEARVKRELTESECMYSIDMNDMNVNVLYPLSLMILYCFAYADCVVSELLSTACLIVLLAVHIILESHGVEGRASFYGGDDRFDHEWRVNGIQNYLASNLWRVHHLNSI
jgi:hypothetical protein